MTNKSLEVIKNKEYPQNIKLIKWKIWELISHLNFALSWKFICNNKWYLKLICFIVVIQESCLIYYYY